ncbi:rhamnogalacturonan acetylesterase RhgT [Streptomyces spiroverticillatus]|uniref:Rhamnogalacturonan acetylesterase RhgT n=1 Tax=Streptomyces finlayi TaxID=67296 RepID=A0A918WVD9_9ACTN|nr:rhamnogalacturonan acetylesterase [Streptomyces finlayi]GHA03077.1 rhamnogalacturonan acetylesterase RhgT [Streptomyces spiroverticillatus]GHC87264.1 rhamnogalacturonan acetylesterase RhgT [Streptomyces finlayi]
MSRPPATRLFIAGGSSATTREISRIPMLGWGQVLPLFLTPDVEVVNCARAGASTRTFIERGRLNWIREEIAPNDFLLLSFGLNDCKPEEYLNSEPFGTFQDYLRQFIDTARERHAHPVLVTPHERRTFDTHGNLRHAIGDYVMATRELGAETSTPVIDMYERSLAWWRQLGPDVSKEYFLHLGPDEHPNYPEGIDDITHLRPPGALTCARFIARALAKERILPSQWVTGLDPNRQFDPKELGWVDDDTHAALVKSRTKRMRSTL